MHEELLMGARQSIGLPASWSSDCVMVVGSVGLTFVICHLVHRFIEVPCMKFRPTQEASRDTVQSVAHAVA